MQSLAYTLDGRNSRITSATVKAPIQKWNYDLCWIVNDRDILKSLLSKQLPPQRINGVLNLISVLDGDGTEDDLENALVNALYVACI